MRFILAATFANLPFGTIYAFSVFLKSMETMLSLTRSDMGLVFGASTVMFATGMNIAPALYTRLSTGAVLIVTSLMGAGGLTLASAAQGFWSLMFGYAILFGLGGGAAFTTAQQMVNLTPTKRRGLVNGYVVGLYPLGAMIGAPLLGWSVEQMGLRQTLLNLSLVVLISGLVAVGLTGLRNHIPKATSTGAAHAEDQATAGEMYLGMIHWSLFFKIAIVFFLAASAGLMVMSQAAGIVQSYGAGSQFAIGATSFITGMIASARITGGWLMDRFSLRQVMCGAHVWSLFGALMLTLWPNPNVALFALAMVGMGYGFVSGSAAGGIGMHWPATQFGVVASRLYIGWCIAAVCLPVLAGWLYDWSNSYRSSIWIAALVNSAGILLAFRLPPRPQKTAPNPTHRQP
jgi:OFA family oxalate/formate antiporter-like MFS transporter